MAAKSLSTPERDAIAEEPLEDSWVPLDEIVAPEELEEMISSKEVHTNAVILESLANTPDAEIKPPDNVLFVSKLNPVTQSEQMMECMKKLQVDWLLEREDKLFIELRNITAKILDEGKLDSVTVAELNSVVNKMMSTHKEIVKKMKVEQVGTCSFHRESIEILENKIADAKEKLEKSRFSALETRVECENQNKLLESLRSNLEEVKEQILDVEKLRKTLHNTALELKGNIRVFCRVRPVMPNKLRAIECPKSGNDIELKLNGQSHVFSFDKVFNDKASQHDVFEEVSELVQSALDGYKVCIFCYGQTNSGKTYTMMGNELNDQSGIIPRSVEKIFEVSQDLNSHGWKYKMQVSMLEIYNETIRDLLTVNNLHPHEATFSKCTINDYDSSVNNLTIVEVANFNEVSFLLNWANQNRSVGRTKMNEQSSRSHYVFTLGMFGLNELTSGQVQGELRMVDLAGSEGLNKSGVTGDRLKETQAINKSLLCLGDVMRSIAKKEYVSFRSSKLTHLLKPCLEGDSKTLMVVNLSPEESSADESLESLRFSAKVNFCKIGIPQQQTQTGISQ